MEDAGRGLRRAQLETDDEEGLLKLQEDFEAGGRQPAAKVSRIGKPRPAAAPAAAPSDGVADGQGAAAPAAAAADAPQALPLAGERAQPRAAAGEEAAAPRPAGALAPSIPGILGDVLERAPGPAAPPAPQPPTEPGAAPRAFPAAAHRGASRFTLGRRNAPGPAATDGSRGAAAAPVAAAAAPPAAEGAEPAAGAPATGGTAAGSELASIDAQNEQQVASMSADEREAALAEVAGRFGSDRLEFLRRRAQAKQQQQQRGAAEDGAGGSAAVGGGTAGSSGAGASSVAKAAARPAAKPGGMRKGFLSAPQKPCAVKQLQQQQGGKDHPAAAPAEGPPPRRPLVARLRFGLGAEVLGADAPGAAAASDEAVLARDQISRDRGAAPEGYTLDELRALARSSHAPQRAAALRALGALLEAARPRLGAEGPGGGPAARALELPASVMEGERALPAPPPAVDWETVREYLVVAVRAVVLLRLGLDDDSTSVFSAAASALRTLLAPASDEAAVWEAADASAAVGWPVAWRGALRRLGASGTWEAAAELLRQSQADGSDGASPDAPEDVAAIDPLAGFLAMEPLPRICWLLRHHAATEAAAPLLAVLSAAAAGARGAAEAVARCQGLPEALAGVLGGEYGGAGPGAPALRPAALRLVRLLVQASPSAAEQLRASGLLTAAQAALLRGPPAGGAGPEEAARDALLRLEALRIWRVAAAQNISLMSMDAMYASLCRLLDAPPPLPADGGGEDEDAAAWQLRCEALQLLEALVSHALRASSGGGLGPEMISPDCVAAVAASAAASWASAGAVERAARALISRAGAELCGGGGEPAHPAALMPPAHAALAALAAAWHAVATCTTGTGPGQRRVASDAWQRLQEAGLAGRSAEAPAVERAAEALEVTRARLAAAVLRVDGGGAPAADGAVGAALADHLSQLVAAGAPSGGSSSSGCGIATACLSAAAASALAALARLEAVACAAAGAPPDRPAPPAAARAASVGAAAVAARAALAGTPPLVLEPWAHAQMQTAQPAARLLLQAAALLPPGDAGPAGTAVFEGLLSLPVITPPGLEAQCVSALQLAFGPPCRAALERALRDSSARMHALRDAGGALADAAAGRRAAGGAAASSARSPYPAPDALDAAALAAALMEGYAAGWLSVVPRERLAPGGGSSGGSGGGDGGGSSGAGDGSGGTVLPQLVRAVGDEPHGSRLPAPRTWAFSEALAVPGGPADPGAPGAANEAPHPSGAALALALTLGVPLLAPAPVQLRAAVEALFLSNAWELLPPQPAAPGRARPQELPPAWQDATARWAFAALAQRAAGGLLDAHAEGLGEQQQRQQQQGAQRAGSEWSDWLGLAALDRLTQVFADSSMGDPLFAATVVLLLLPAGGEALRRAAWSALGAHCALHLLPPAAGCAGGGQPYLAGPFDFGFVSEAAKSLAQGELSKAQQLGSVSWDVALHAAAAAALDPAAWAAADDAAAKSGPGNGVDGSSGGGGGGGGGGGAVGSAGRATNVLRGVVRAAPAEAVAALLRAAEARGIAPSEARRALVLACHGDAALMERASRAMEEAR
ncbi:hypothetical protein Rsub_05189 [Raphidocelis subcapitata]|uniref:RNA polymerase II-associated protein 1 C-terminal domain-containing protein n=1 Tax=Raphidocelis subcapitata TaxID=307507 RepID=A0A2V0P666_9CHLO|nr:hypothetical protein Rsub_05189 [Raphidocelis subcapitata]|eukprot:GBF92575.1 hypothetical protein Rsub_05189 [Raphidocelis subcapitata]